MFRTFSRSLSIRLLAVFLVLGGLFVFGTFLAIQTFYNSDSIRGLISGHLSLHVNYVREDIGVPPRIDRALAITQKVPVDIRLSGPSIDWASDPNFPRLSELDFAASPKFSNSRDAWADELQGVEFAALDDHNFLRIRQGGYDIVVSSPRISDVSEGIDLIPSILGLGLLSLVLAYAAVRWLFQPILAIQKGAERIGQGDFGYRINRVRQDQLGELATDINNMAGDVQNMLDAKRALLLGVSHELRTPLSRMRLTLEFVDDEENADSLREEIVEMEKIVTSLLEAERLNGRHAQLTRQRVDVGDLIGEMLDDFFSREHERIEVKLPNHAILADLDEVRIALLLKNLLSNALRYSQPEDGPVMLRAWTEGDDLVITVTDFGPGLSMDQAEHIGEPFYRADPSRTRSSGGTGLGLYLATLVVRAHNGTMRLLDVPHRGACFEVRIPASS